MSFQILTKSKRNMGLAPMASIGVGGSLYLNVAAMRSFFDGVRHVLIFYDSERKVLGIRPIKKAEKDSYRVNYSSQASRTTGIVSARSPLKAIGLNKIARKNLLLTWNDRHKLAEFSVK